MASLAIKTTVGSCLVCSRDESIVIGSEIAFSETGQRMFVVSSVSDITVCGRCTRVAKRLRAF